MLILEKNLHFIHIPKTGGSYIEIYILKHLYGENTVNRWNFKHFMPKHLYHKDKMNAYHMPISVISGKYPTLKSFCIIRDPFDVRKSAFCWLQKHIHYKKTFSTYIANYDFTRLPAAHTPPAFGLTQSEYIDETVKIFLYEDFEKCLDYIDSIFGKKIKRIDKVNKSDSHKISIDIESKKIIQNYFEKDIALRKQLLQ